MPNVLAREGQEFIANRTTFGDQLRPAVTKLVSGRFVIVWDDLSRTGGDTDVGAIRGQVFDAQFNPIGDEFLVNSSTVGNQADAKVTSLSGGGFVVSWTNYNSEGDPLDGSAASARAQLYDANGARVGGEFLLNSTTAQYQMQPSVTGLPSGGFVAVWNDVPGLLSRHGTIKGQLFSSTGDKVGAEFTVNTFGAEHQHSAFAITLADGRFLVTWTDATPHSTATADGSGHSAQGQLFSASGERIGGQFTVNEIAEGNQHANSVAPLASGGFVAVWSSTSADGSGSGVEGQVFDANGSRVGGEFLVNTVTYGTQIDASVAGLPSGSFVVSWTDHSNRGPIGAWSAVKGQAYDAFGNRVGGEFTINSFDSQHDESALVAVDADSFAAIWHGGRGPGSGEYSPGDIRVQIFTAPSADAPAVARDDAFVTDEATAVSGSLFADNGPGADSDADGPALQISAVNGAAASVGQTITLASGARLTVSANGTFSYDPNGKFDHLTQPGRGLGATQASDSFTYTLAGGGTATALITVNGVGTSGGKIVTGTAGDDSLAGTAGPDILEGLDGNDTLQGLAGDDLLIGGGGADVMKGGAGNDVYEVNAGDTVTELANEGTDEVRTGLGSKLDHSRLYVLPENVENLTGTSTTAQGVRDNALNNGIAMGAGADLVVLEAGGDDSVSGGGGNDYFYWGGTFTNADSANGGAGTDTLALLGTYAMTFDADDLIGIEKLAPFSSGDPGAPSSYGLTTHDANVAAGQTLMVAAQSLQPGEVLAFNGAAELDGRFNVRGGKGTDTITGGAGNDLIWGNLGADELRGGAGKDQFDYNAVAESKTGAADTIFDFTRGDKIFLARIDADGNAANGDSKFSWLGAEAFTGVAGQLRVSQDPQNGGKWVVEADVDGDKVADLTIYLVAPADFLPQQSDFTL